MRSHPVTITESATLREIVTAFDLYQQPAIAVLNVEGWMVGAIDVRRLATHVREHGLEASWRDVLDREYPVCRPDDDVRVAYERLESGRGSGVLVVQDERVIGYLGWPEICCALLDEALQSKGVSD